MGWGRKGIEAIWQLHWDSTSCGSLATAPLLARTLKRSKPSTSGSWRCRPPAGTSLAGGLPRMLQRVWCSLPDPEPWTLNLYLEAVPIGV